MTTSARNEHQGDLLSHFEELRRRLLFAMLAVILGMVIGWFLYPFVYQLIARPVLAVVHAHGGRVFTLQPGEAFFTQVKLSIVLGVILSSPVVLWQLWAFVNPGLTPRERRAVAPLAPAVCGLFLFGSLFAYYFLTPVMTFFQGFSPAGVEFNLSYQHSIDFPLKIILAFGLAFQLPVVLVGLVLLRVLTPRALLRHWRYAILGLGILAAIITPTGDPFNWSLMMLPLLLLYFGTVLVSFRLVKGGDGEIASGDTAP